MAHESDRNSGTHHYEKETIVRTAATERPFTTGQRVSAPLYSDEVSSSDVTLTGYLKGFGRVGRHCFKAYKEVVVDVFQSLLVLFLQHPSVGILCVVTGVFVAVPIAVFIGFAIVSFLSAIVTAMIVEGTILAIGIAVLFFVVPVAFVMGLGTAVGTLGLWLAANAAHKVIRGRGIFEKQHDL